MDGFSPDQIWEQLQLRNNVLLKRLESAAEELGPRKKLKLSKIDLDEETQPVKSKKGKHSKKEDELVGSDDMDGLELDSDVDELGEGDSDANDDGLDGLDDADMDELEDGEDEDSEGGDEDDGEGGDDEDEFADFVGPEEPTLPEDEDSEADVDPVELMGDLGDDAPDTDDEDEDGAPPGFTDALPSSSVFRFI